MAQLVCHTKRANGKQTTSLLPVITLTIQPSGSGDLAAISSPIPNVSTAATQFLFFFYNQSCTLYQWLHCYYEVFAETEGLWKSNVSQMKQFWSADFTARLVGRGTPAHMYHMDYEIFAMSTQLSARRWPMLHLFRVLSYVGAKPAWYWTQKTDTVTIMNDAH